MQKDQNRCIDEGESPLTRIAHQKVQDLQSVAWEAYKNGQLKHAATVFRNALQLAESMQLKTALEGLRFMLGVCLFEAGELKPALAALGPNLQEVSFRRDPTSAYKASTVYLDVAIRLPIDLWTIQKADTNIESFLNSTGHSSWKHRLLFQRSRLFAERGMIQVALKTSQEAWSAWGADADKTNSPSYNSDAHFNQLVTMALRVNNASLARRYMHEWEQRESEMPVTRELMLWSRRSELALCEGHLQEAVDHGRQAALIAKLHDHHGALFDATSSLLRALLHFGDAARARVALAELLSWRHSENTHEQYVALLLRADYSLLCLQQLLCLRALPKESATSSFPNRDHKEVAIEHEIEYAVGSVQRTPGAPNALPERPVEEWLSLPKAKMDLRLDSRIAQTADSKKANQLLARTQKAYAEVLKVGREIDSKLECTWRQSEIADRLAQLNTCIGYASYPQVRQ